MTAEFAQRRRQLAELLKQRRLDAFVVWALPNVRYLTGFTGSNAALLVEQSGETILFTDPRYQLQARREADCRVKISRQPLPKAVAAAARRRKLRRVGFEAARMSFAEYKILDDGLSLEATLEPQTGLVESLRMVKSPAEIEAIRDSMRVAATAYQKALGKLRSGILEIELAAEIEYQMRRLGAERPAFQTIVLFGERTAQPHASPGPNPLLRNQLVLVDVGAVRQGYSSDMTRVLAHGNIPSRLKRAYRAVLEAQAAAADAVRPGIKAGAVDATARRVLRRYGLEESFLHSTGHGVGLEVHEAPRLGKRDRVSLQAGMVVTIEPGVYLEGIGGIRLEDTVVVTSGGCENLTPLPKELLVL